MPERPAPAFRIKRLLPFSSAVMERIRIAASAATRSAAASRDRIRAWVPGCKTGGLAYGITMLLRECTPCPSRRVQVFGTDDDEEALRFARAGRYPAGAALGLDPGLRGRYTFDEGDTLRMAETLRESCIFAPHRLGRNAALSRLDLIVCHRIFEGMPASRRDDVVRALYFALRDDGVLLALDHRNHFPDQLFQLTSDGYFRPRSSRRRVSRSYLRLEGTDAPPSPPGDGQAPERDVAPGWELEVDDTLVALGEAVDRLNQLTANAPRLAVLQRDLRCRLLHASRLVDVLVNMSRIGGSHAGRGPGVKVPRR
ncbi:MAG TPA: CheR family methyltransferase [Polyangiaceae bacterium]|nr:CheR family methyltransferase [Polyangiaceae bacterium]